MDELIKFSKTNRGNKADILDKVLDRHNAGWGIDNITKGVSRGLGKLTGGMIGTTPRELQGLGGVPSAVAFLKRNQPKYAGITGKGGQLLSQYSLTAAPQGGFQQRLAGLAQQSPEQFAAQQLAAQQQSFQQRISGAQAGAMGQAEQQMAGLAARGGIGGGLRERLAAGAGEQAALQRQALRGEAEGARLGTLAGAVDQQRALQESIANREQREREFDVQQRIGEVRNKQAAEELKFKALAAAHGADVAQMQAVADKKRAARGAFGSLAGGAIGAFGGPGGAMIGSQLGGSLFS